MSEMGILQQLGPQARTNLQRFHVAVEMPHAHYPRKVKEPNSMNDCPSARLHYAIWRGNHSEWILFRLARYNGAVPAKVSLPEYAVENQNRYPVLLSLD